MKNTLLDHASKVAIMARIEKLQPNSPALWGKMNASQALCHLADQLRVAMGDIKVEGKAGFFGRYLLKPLVLLGLPAPKGKTPTFPELDQMTAGTKPTHFETDRQTLYYLIEEVLAKGPDFLWRSHAVFGTLSYHQWCRLAWIHLDHHLKQFGV